jgi:hypothetical protein
MRLRGGRTGPLPSSGTPHSAEQGPRPCCRYACGYRNNVGWRPLLFFTGHGVEYPPPESGSPIKLMIWYELWNRRRYPIVIRSMKLKFAEWRVPDDWQHKDWHASGPNSVLDHRDHVLEPTSHSRFIGYSSAVHPSSDNKITLRVSYMDPRTGRRRLITRNRSIRLRRLIAPSEITRYDEHRPSTPISVGDEGETKSAAGTI